MGLKLVGCVVLCACQILRFVSPTWTVLYDPLLTHEHQTKANHPYKKTCRNRAKPEKNSALYYDYYMIYQDSLRKMLLAKTRWIQNHCFLSPETTHLTPGSTPKGVKALLKHFWNCCPIGRILFNLGKQKLKTVKNEELPSSLESQLILSHLLPKGGTQLGLSSQ